MNEGYHNNEGKVMEQKLLNLSKEVWKYEFSSI